jgi:CRP-like cAMP-binding protein
VDTFGAAGAVVPLGLGSVLLALACWRAVARLDLRARYLPAELALLRSVPFIDALPPYDVERLARRGRWVDVPAGEVVVQQGDRGHEFFGIGVGEVSITIDGVRKPGTIGEGGYFGEIALLRAIPRTATVTAETPCRLFVLEARDFIAAVTGGTDGSAMAFEVSQGYDDLKQTR